MLKIYKHPDFIVNCYKQLDIDDTVLHYGMNHSVFLFWSVMKDFVSRAYFAVTSLCLSPGLTEGAGVLPDGPLNAAVGGKVMFTTTLTPGTTFGTVNWKFGTKDIFNFYEGNFTVPEYEGRITFFMSTGSLELRNLALTDTGAYSVTMFIAGEGSHPGLARLDVNGEKVSHVAYLSLLNEGFALSY